MMYKVIVKQVFQKFNIQQQIFEFNSKTTSSLTFTSPISTASHQTSRFSRKQEQIYFILLVAAKIKKISLKFCQCDSEIFCKVFRCVPSFIQITSILFFFSSVYLKQLYRQWKQQGKIGKCYIYSNNNLLRWSLLTMTWIFLTTSMMEIASNNTLSFVLSYSKVLTTNYKAIKIQMQSCKNVFINLLIKLFTHIIKHIIQCL